MWVCGEWWFYVFLVMFNKGFLPKELKRNKVQECVMQWCGVKPHRVGSPEWGRMIGEKISNIIVLISNI